MIIPIMKKPSLLLLLVLLSTQLYAVSELHVKGIFLEKFTHLIEWPKNDASHFTLCVINDEAFADILTNIYANKTLKNKPVKIISLTQADRVPDCQLLFIAKKTKNIRHILTQASQNAVLTVCDYKPFILEGVIITMFLNEKRFNYIINNNKAKDSNIRISYLLLKSAQEVIQ